MCKLWRPICKHASLWNQNPEIALKLPALHSMCPIESSPLRHWQGLQNGISLSLLSVSPGYGGRGIVYSGWVCLYQVSPLPDNVESDNEVLRTILSSRDNELLVLKKQTVHVHCQWDEALSAMMTRNWIHPTISHLGIRQLSFKQLCNLVNL